MALVVTSAVKAVVEAVVSFSWRCRQANDAIQVVPSIFPTLPPPRPLDRSTEAALSTLAAAAASEAARVVPLAPEAAAGAAAPAGLEADWEVAAALLYTRSLRRPAHWPGPPRTLPCAPHRRKRRRPWWQLFDDD